jgi:hypothetical protein
MGFCPAIICLQHFVNRFDNIRNHLSGFLISNPARHSFFSEVFIGITNRQVKEEKERTLYSSRRSGL